MKTLKNEIRLSGVGLHSGSAAAVTLVPSEGEWINFVNQKGASSVTQAVIEEDSRLTGFSLPNGMTVRTAEHLLAAVAGMGLEAVDIHLEGQEVPIMDGSALPFAQAIRETGFRDNGKKSRPRFLATPLIAEENNGARLMFAYPSEKLRVTYIIDYSGTPVGLQKFSCDITEENFYNIIAGARTFGLTSELGYLRQHGLAKGGSKENALIFDENGLVEGQQLRHPQECSIHKITDLLGDLTLSGPVPTAHYVGLASGHSVHAKLVRSLRALFAC